MDQRPHQAEKWNMPPSSTPRPRNPIAEFTSCEGTRGKWEVKAKPKCHDFSSARLVDAELHNENFLVSQIVMVPLLRRTAIPIDQLNSPTGGYHGIGDGTSRLGFQKLEVKGKERLI